MKKITEYRKLFGVNSNYTLSELKSIYRNLMKEWHPDKFMDDNDKANAELKSKEIIEAYHFLVSISDETHANNQEEYAEIMNTAVIDDYSYKGLTLTITFNNGCVYEYFGVPKNVFNKLNASAALARFARRHIYTSYTYRKASKQTVE